MIEIYDTTLRDGTQGEGVSLTLGDKLRVTEWLDDFGVAAIEGGWPGSNAKDAGYFRAARRLELKRARVVAFGSTRRPGSDSNDDANLRALLDAETEVVTIFGKSSIRHVTRALKTTLDENLRMVEQSVAHLRRSGRRVIFDAEHFFDGYEEDADYALRVLKAAREGGAERLVLCDTNGGHLPWRVEEIVRRAAGEIETPLGIHAHNDSGCAVANSLAAVRAGATHVQGTINGIGERCGNADLCATIADLELKLDRRCLPEGGLGRLTDLARRVAEIVNAAPPGAAPYVGRSAFAHKGGVHVAAIRRDPGAYEHVDPAVVGNETRVLVSELSGRGNLRSFADRIGVEIENASAGEMLGRIKELERDGFAFEAAPATVELMLRREGKDYRPFFELIDFHVVVEHRAGRGHLAEANVKVSVGGDVMHTAAEGPGPVAALDAALRKALAERYPVIDRFEIADYKVRTLDADRGAASGVRVLVDTSDGDARWSTVGASRNIIEASWRALFDGYEYGLLQASEGRWPAERASAAAQAG